MKTHYYIAGFLAILSAVFGIAMGIWVLGLPGVLALADFPANMIPQFPIFHKIVNTIGYSSLVLGSILLIGGIGLFWRKKWANWVTLIDSIVSIAAIIYVLIMYIKEILPATREVFMMIQEPQGAWLFKLHGALLIALLMSLPLAVIIYLGIKILWKNSRKNPKLSNQK